MSSIVNKIKRNKQDLTLSKYLKNSFDNGFNQGTKETINAYLKEIKKLKDIEGMTGEMFTKIVKQLEVEDLI